MRGLSAARRALLVAAPLLVLAFPPREPAVRAQSDDGPRLFAPGIVSTEAPEFATAFSPDGRDVYFNRATPDRGRFDLLHAHFDHGRWHGAFRPGFASGFRDPDPFVTHDGRRVYFSSNRPASGETARPDFDLWFAERRDDGWGEAMPLGPAVNSSSNEVFCSLTAAGDLYFASDRGGAMAIYVAQAAATGFVSATRVDLPLPPSVAPSNPLIDPQGRFLVFAAEGPDSLGGTDLYVSDRTGEMWSTPRNLGARVNSRFADFAPAFGADGLTLYFTSERPGVASSPQSGRPPGDIYAIDARAVGLAPRTPGVRNAHAMAFDGQRVILVGGADAASVRGDTWGWDGAEWARLPVRRQSGALRCGWACRLRHAR